MVGEAQTRSADLYARVNGGREKTGGKNAVKKIEKA